MKTLKKIYKKILDSEDKLNLAIQEIKKKSKRLVFTNGCFDILHRGHIEYLSKAKDLGDILIVAINSDESVKKIKGSNRPINSLNDRMFLLASLAFVDYVTYFEESTPIEIIKKIQPNIHVKGGDYRIEDLPEKKIIESYGGTIQILSFVEGYSTSSIIKKIKK